MPLFFVQIVAAHYLPSTSRNWHLPPKIRMPSTGDGRAGALFASWWGATSEGVTSTFWKNSFFGVPVRFSGTRCKKRGHKKRKTAGVMPLFSRSSLYSLSEWEYVAAVVWSITSTKINVTVRVSTNCTRFDNLALLLRLGYIYSVQHPTQQHVYSPYRIMRYSLWVETIHKYTPRW